MEHTRRKEEFWRQQAQTDRNHTRITTEKLRSTTAELQSTTEKLRSTTKGLAQARGEMESWRLQTQMYRNHTTEDWNDWNRHPRTLILVVLLNYVARLPILHDLYHCNHDVHVLFVVVEVRGSIGGPINGHPYPMNVTSAEHACNTLLGDRRRASCSAVRYPVTMLHAIVHELLVRKTPEELRLPSSCTRQAHGALSCDLLFTHADMVVNLRRDGFWFANPAVRWSSWLGSGMSFYFGPSCFSLYGPANEEGVRNVSARFDERSEWATKTREIGTKHKNPGRIGQSRKLCHEMAAAAGFTTCCFGWADMLFLPRSHQHLFVRYAEHFLSMGPATGCQTGNEVAVPTILRNIELLTSGARLYRRVKCTGSCCSSPKLDEALRAHACAHAVHMQLIDPTDKKLPCGLSGGQGSTLPPGASPDYRQGVPGLDSGRGQLF